MINNNEFIKRLKQIIDYYDESASSFAEKINVQRSSISHILSGRNKPSLDFVLKVLNSYPEVELYWLLNGKGSFPMTKKDLPNQANEIHKEDDLKPIKNNKKISRIVIFYNDGSFEDFEK